MLEQEMDKYGDFSKDTGILLGDNPAKWVKNAFSSQLRCSV